MDLTLIAAVSDINGRRIISDKGNIPWFKDDEIRKSDLIRFKQLTIHRPIIMGRVTFDSLKNKPLPKRTNIVISDSPELNIASGIVYHAFNLEEAIQMASNFGNLAYCIGGSRIYKQFIDSPYSTKLEITEIKEAYSGDAQFPFIDKNIWKLTNSEEHEKYNFLTYERK